MFDWLRRLVGWIRGKPRVDLPLRRVEIMMDYSQLEMIRWYANGINLSVQEFMVKASLGSIPEDYQARYQIVTSEEVALSTTFELDGELSEEAAFDASNVFPFPPRPRLRVPEHAATFNVVVDPTLKHPCLYLSATMPAHLSRGEAEGSCQYQGGKPCFYNASRVRLCQVFKPKNLLASRS